MSSTHGISEWKKRSVVSSFIFKFDDAGKEVPKVALFQRGDKVSTYRHHLAPISGSIESTDPSPLAAAWREISEETTLTSSSLTLLRQGKSYSFSDPSVKREWTIYPFLFRLKTAADEQHIQIDWEHEDWGWHDPNQVIKDDTYTSKGVPRLAESLRRVWFETDLGPEAGKVLSKGLDTLAHDHESGARQLAGIALQTLRDVVSTLALASEPQEWWKQVRFAAWHLSKNGRESMGAAITSALLSALAQLEELIFPFQSSQLPTDKVLSTLDDLISARQSSIASISSAFQSFLTSNPFPSESAASTSQISILTLSESSTISQTLKNPSLPPLDIRILESRPLFEGISLASSLLSSSPFSSTSSHKISLYPDTSPALASTDPTKIQIVLIGADRISSSGSVLNKTGSLPAVLTAKFVNPSVKVVALGETEKIAPPGLESDHALEENAPELVTRAWEADYNSQRVRDGAQLIKKLGNDQVPVRNVFFEWIPASLVDVYVTEKGVWSVDEIADHAKNLGKEQARLFGNL